MKTLRMAIKTPVMKKNFRQKEKCIIWWSSHWNQEQRKRKQRRKSNRDHELCKFSSIRNLILRV